MLIGLVARLLGLGLTTTGICQPWLSDVAPTAVDDGQAEGPQVPSPSTRVMGEHDHAEEWRRAGRHTADSWEADPPTAEVYDRRWRSSATAALVVEHGPMGDDGPAIQGLG